MTALALYRPFDSSEVRRWSLSAIAIVLIHAGLIALALLWYARPIPVGTTIDAIAVEFAPASSAPEIREQDIAPGPEMQEADAPPPEPPKQEQAIESIPPAPVQPDPAVVAPPMLELRPRIEPDKPKPVEAQPTKKPDRQPPAPRTTAPPKAARVGPEINSTASGASAAAAAADYGARLAQHLQRFKQYPAASRAAGEQGTARLSFTVSRSGGVLSARLAGSSGSGALDAETLALIRRAQPLPAFPPEMREASRSFTVPIRYSLR